MQDLPFQQWISPWHLSCLLASECALAGKWTGNGVGHYHRTDLPRNPMAETLNVDLRAISLDEKGNAKNQAKGKTCATSMCGKYYIVAFDTKIYIYEMNGLSFQIVSRISCNKTVQTVALDASRDSFAMAAILEGRVGLFRDMENTPLPEAVDPWEVANMQSGPASQWPLMELFNAGVRDPWSGVRDITMGEVDELSINAGSLGASTLLHPSTNVASQLSWVRYDRDSKARWSGIRSVQSASDTAWPDELENVEIVKGKMSKSKQPSLLPNVFRNICDENDPPISLAISPTRSSVAFGNKTGVELHWVRISHWLKLLL
jgi:hypothetical protein